LPSSTCASPDGGLGTDIAAALLPLGRIGVLYATGNISQVVLTTADGDACLSKPYRSVDLLRSLEIVAEIVATGKALPPYPRGFQVLSAATAPPRVAAGTTTAQKSVSSFASRRRLPALATLPCARVIC